VRLFLVRHAEAAPGEPDALRPLTPGGRTSARALGARLAAEQPDAVVSSPLLRARETAEQIARAAGLVAAVDERLAPGATAAGLREAINGLGETVVVVAHQPDCSEILVELGGEDRPFAPGATAVIDL
jgi:phosphohistidine phosphatase